MADLVVDTDVVSFGFRQDSRFVDMYGPAIQGHRLIISFMTIAELQYGAMNRRWGDQRIAALHAYLEKHYVRYGVTESLCHTWAGLIWESKQQGRILSGSDAWIAATAIILGTPLVTLNGKEFQHLKGITLVTFPAQ